MRWLVRRLERLLPVVDADMAAMCAVGMGLTPADEGLPPVRMAREEVDVWLFPNLAVVEATFDMKNEGGAVDLEVGFPCFGTRSIYRLGGVDLRDFEASVDGRALADAERRVDNTHFPLWRVWRQRFEARSTTRVRVRYWTPLEGYRGMSRLPFVYVLRTGRFWHGIVGEAVVRVHAVDMPITVAREATPAGYEVDHERARLTWTFRDFVPSHDIGLLVSPASIFGACVGLRALDPVELYDLRPPAGEVVTIGGLLLVLQRHLLADAEKPCGSAGLKGAQTKKLGRLLRAGTVVVLGDPSPHAGAAPVVPMQSERYFDTNLTVPDGISIFESRSADGQAPPTAVDCHFGPQTRRSKATLPRWSKWPDWRYLVTGRVGYAEGRPILYVDEWFEPELDERLWPASSSLTTHFPWVKYRVDESSDGYDKPTRWLGGSTRYDDGGRSTAPGARARVPYPGE